jgi:tRNA 5-methylaminomethyl-2-thiouridine biosynthesis bifunctional protein
MLVLFMHAADIQAVFAKERAQFQILEVGFGAGENFFATCASWHAAKKQGTRLHYVALEPTPLTRSELSASLFGKFSDAEKLATLTQKLIAHWPPAIAGFHTLELDPDLLLTLVFGDAATYWSQIVGQFDLIFGDPSFAKASRIASRISSQVESVTGTSSQQAIVIGAGIAGASVARALARRGMAVTVLERDVPASGSSGNPVAVVRAEPGGPHNPVTTLTAAGIIWLKCWMAQHGQAIEHDFCGAIRLTRDEKRHLKLAQHAERSPADWLEQLTQDQASDLSGHLVADPGFLLPYAGWLQPVALVSTLLDHPLINVRTGVNVKALKKMADHQWCIQLADGDTLSSQCVILASAHSENLSPLELKIDSARGQLSYLPQRAERQLNKIICRDGYMTPAVNGMHTIGATLQQGDDDALPRAADDVENFQRLLRLLPGFAEDAAQLQSGRVAWRAVTQDRLPIVGSIDAGLYASLAHGARGITCAPLCGEWLAAMIMGEVQPLAAKWQDLLDPLRFAVKN